MKKQLLTCFLLLLAAVSIAQDVKYKKVYYKDQSMETMDALVTVTDAVALSGGLKLKIIVSNKTNDYILFKPAECEFRIKGSATRPEEKPLWIKPRDKESLVLEIKVASLSPENFNFLLGGLYRITLNGNIMNAPEFSLPAATNSFKAGDFSFSLEKSKKETNYSSAKFNVSYNGNHIGIIQPSKITMRMPDGTEYINSNKDKAIFLEKGKTNDFTPGWKDIPASSGDMQLSKLSIDFHDAFREAIPVKIPPVELNMLFDKETSDAKGR
jgi:hypothetical protein